MPRPPKPLDERKKSRSEANKRYYQRHKDQILAQRAVAVTPAPELWLTLKYHDSLEDFVQSISVLGIPNKLYRHELEALMRVIEIISEKWEKCEEDEKEVDAYEERLSCLR